MKYLGEINVIGCVRKIVIHLIKFFIKVPTKQNKIYLIELIFSCSCYIISLALQRTFYKAIMYRDFAEMLLRFYDIQKVL